MFCGYIALRGEIKQISASWLCLYANKINRNREKMTEMFPCAPLQAFLSCSSDPEQKRVRDGCRILHGEEKVVHLWKNYAKIMYQIEVSWNFTAA